MWQGRSVVIALALSARLLQGQAGVTGQVRNVRGEPVGGAQVALLRAGVSTTTNELGAYRLRLDAGPAASGQDTIRVTRLGYRVTLAPIVLGPGQNRRDIEVVPLAVSLATLVVTGTAVGSQQLSAQPAVIATIDAAALARNAPVRSLSDMLTARVAGVQVLQSTGTAGTSQSIRIRGSASISLSKEPLLYVDGVLVDSRNTSSFNVGGQTASRLNDLNPADIESIEIVKGPAAATLYGADASAGVIQVITKRGRPGANQPFAHTISLQGDRITMPWTPSDNFGACTAPLVAASSLNPLCRGQAVGTIVRDNPLLRDGVFRTGGLRSADWSGRGGGANYAFFMSLGDNREDGVFYNNYFTRRNGRVNLNWQPHADWQLNAATTVVGTETRLPNNDNGLGFMVLTRSGSPLTVVDDSVANALGQRNGWFQPNRRREALENIDNRLHTRRSITTVTANHQPTPWFSNRLTMGLDLSTTEGRQLFPKNLQQWYPGTQNDGNLLEDRTSSSQGTVDYQGNLHGARGSWAADLSFGAQLLDNRTTDLAASGTGLITNANANVTVTPAVSRTLAQASVQNRSIGLLSQLQLSHRERLFLQFGLRADRNSAFGDDAPVFYLPKVGVSWLVAGGPDGRAAGSWLNTLKVRAAMGTSGRSPTPGAALQTYLAAPYIVNAATTAAGVQPASPGNTALEPERGVEIEGGLDAGLFGERLAVDLTWFQKRSKDLLILQVLPPSLGFSASPFVNLGSAVNRGLELSTRLTLLSRQHIGWEVNTAMSTLHNELEDLGGVSAFGSPVRFNVGRQLAYWNSLKIRQVDTVAGRVIVSDTAEFLGNQVPRFTGVAGSTVTLLKYLRITGQVDWKDGYRIYNLGDDVRDRTSANRPSERSVKRDQLPAADRLRFFGPYVTEGKSAPSRPVSVDQVIEPYIQDASFVRLREVSMTLSVPQALARRLRMSAAEVTLAGRNLHLWTDYEGPDPEVQRNPNEQSILIDQWTAPPVRRYVLRLNIQF